MNMFDKRMRERLITSNENIKKIQHALSARYVGHRVKLTNDRRGQGSHRRYKTGQEFIIYDVLVEGRDIGLWLSRVEDAAYPRFELSVWLREVEFLPPRKTK